MYRDPAPPIQHEVADSLWKDRALPMSSHHKAEGTPEFGITKPTDNTFETNRQIETDEFIQTPSRDQFINHISTREPVAEVKSLNNWVESRICFHNPDPCTRPQTQPVTL